MDITHIKVRYKGSTRSNYFQVKSIETSGFYNQILATDNGSNFVVNAENIVSFGYLAPSGYYTELETYEDYKANYQEDSKENKNEAVNPKELAGSSKAPTFSVIPVSVIMELGIAMSEGAEKYGAFNFRDTKIKNSIYMDALFRHYAAFIEGEDIDEDSGLSHVTKMISTLVVLRDSMLNGTWVDDRPKPNKGFTVEKMNELYNENK